MFVKFYLFVSHFYSLL